MSITISTDVVCDECSAWIDGTFANRPMVAQARRQAKLLGWSRRGGRDLCPECSESIDEPTQPPSHGSDSALG